MLAQKREFINRLGGDDVQNMFEDKFENVGHWESPANVDNLVDDFTDILFLVADS